MRRSVVETARHQRLTNEPPYHNITRRLAHDSNPHTAFVALREIIHNSTPTEVFNICTDESVAARLNDKQWNSLRYQAAVSRPGTAADTATLKYLAWDPVPVVAAAALVIPWICPATRRRVKRHDRYLRKVMRIMRGRRWCAWTAFTDPDTQPRLSNRLLAAADAATDQLRLSCWPGADWTAPRVYAAETQWEISNKEQSRPAFIGDACRAQQFCHDILTDPSLLRRHPYTAAFADTFEVRYDRRIRNAGEALNSWEPLTIRVNPRYANSRVLLHELAHLLIFANPRFRN